MCLQRTTYLPTCHLKISTTNLRSRACITRKSHTNRTQNSQVIAKYWTESKNCLSRRPFSKSKVITNQQAKVGNKTQIRSLDLITAKHSKKLKVKHQQTLLAVLYKVQQVEIMHQSLLSESGKPKTFVQTSLK